MKRKRDDAGSPSGVKHRLRSSAKTNSSVSNPGVANESKNLESTEKGERYLSDGVSFDADSDCDSDLPVISLDSSQTNAGRSYKRGDVIWVPYKERNRTEVLWPAVITSVSKDIVKHHWVDGQRGRDFVYKCNIKRVISFNDEAKNLELRDLGMMHYSLDFKDAYALVTQYFLHCTGGEEISAIRFLTHCKETDDVNHANDRLFRMGVKVKSEDEDDDEDEDDHILNEINDTEEESKAPVEQIVNGETERIWKSDIDKPSETLTQEELLHLRSEAENILLIIKSNECYLLLKSILKGTEESERHKLFPHPELQSQTGLGPFTNFPDLTDEFICTMEIHREKLHSETKEKITSLYCYNVLWPEGIIFAVMKMRHFSITKKEANSHFLETCTKVGQMCGS